MKVRRLFLLLTLTVAFCVPIFSVSGQVAAVNIFKNCGENDPNYTPDVCSDVAQQKGNDGTDNPIVNIIKVAITILSYIIGIAAVIGIIVSGIRFITAGGDSNSVASARTGLIYSLIGIAVVALARILVAFVLSKVQ